MSDITLNKLPSPTWNWLCVNKTELLDAAFTNDAKAEIKCPVDVEKLQSGISFENIKTGAGEGVTAALDGIKQYGLQVKSEVKEPVSFKFLLENKTGAKINLNAKKNSKAVLIEEFTSENSGDAAVSTKINLEDGAEVHLIQVQKNAKDFNFINDVGIAQGENSKFTLTQIILDGLNTYVGVRSDMTGKKSEFKSDTGYIQAGNGKLDINYVTSQFGKKTLSNIAVHGVLKDKAKKIFRGTIDFKEGSSGSKGTENEDVLMIDTDVENKTVPVILCHEEDVEGNHGATIGKLDEDTLFYMQTRGIPEEEVYKIMADAKIAAVAALIPDDKTRENVYKMLGRNTEPEE